MNLEPLRTALRGQFITRDSAEYDSARRIWNGMIDKRPLAIIRPQGVADVIPTVQFAAEHNLLLAIRGGGHNAAGLATCDDGLVLDMGSMRGAIIDPRRR